MSYDDTVATHWPEFAANGKGDITVRQMMSHQAGLPYVDADLTFDDLMAVDSGRGSARRAGPIWEPGSKHGYHAVTYGWLAGELVRRVDGRRIGRYFAEEVAAPLGPRVLDRSARVGGARVSPSRVRPPARRPERAGADRAVHGPGTMLHKTLTVNGS